MTISARLKVLVVSSIVFVVVCSFLVYSSIPWEEYETATRPTNIPRGNSVELYSPLNSVDLAGSLDYYVFTHVVRDNVSVNYTSIEFHVYSCSSNGDLVSFNVTVRNWSSGPGVLRTNHTLVYRVLVDTRLDNVIMVEKYVDGTSNYHTSNVVEEVNHLVREPFTVSEYEKILGYLGIIVVDGSLVTMSNYTGTGLKPITDTVFGKGSRGFRIYVGFPYMDDESPWALSQHYKWESIYGSHPVNITFDIVEMPGTGKWLVTYMHVELENGVIHDYFLGNITLRGI